MPKLLYRLEEWWKIGKAEMNEIGKIQERALKKTFWSISTSYIGLIMETGAWQANQRMQYSTMMLYNNIMSRKNNISRTNKKQPQEHHDLKSATNSTKNRSGNKKCGDHEQIEIEKAGNRKKSLEERT